MFRIGKRYLQPIPVILAVLFLMVQVSADLSLPTITSNIINKGIAQNDIDYIWRMGGIMLLIAIAGWSGAALNVFFAATQSQRLGMKLRSALFRKVTFMDAKNVPDNKLMWYVIIHLTFVLSAFVMGYLDRLTKVKH